MATYRATLVYKNSSTKMNVKDDDSDSNVTKKVLWGIQGISSKSNLKPEKSPSFAVNLNDKTTEWHLHLYPNGNSEETKGFVGIYLHLDKTNCNFSVEFRLGLIGQAGNLMSLEMIKQKAFFEVDGMGFGVQKVLNLNDLMNSAKKFIVNENLSVVCVISVIFKEILQNECRDLDKTLSLDFKNMFEEGIFTDFKIQTKDGKVLNVHKSILAARSKVFKSMLCSDMKEIKESAMEVSDLDFTTMKEVLRFIYCNEVENLDEIASDLIYAAEKYDLDGLKKICIDSMIKTLSVENVIQALVIAECVSESRKLFEKCLDLIKSNYQVIIKTKQWKEMEHGLSSKVQHELVCLSSNTIFI